MKLHGAILAAALIAVAPAAAQQASPSEDAFKQLRLQAQGAATICDASDGDIAYIGPTDEGLVDCLKAHPYAISLWITSLGGPVIPAMDAARIIDARGIDVTVIGFCGSSCGNYIAAAARYLTVLEDSAIMLHGAPPGELSDMQARASDALSAAGFPEDEIAGGLLDQAVAQLREQRAAHDRFAADFAVGSEWYDLTSYYRALESLGGAKLLIVSPDFARLCLSRPEIESYWYPADAAQRQRLEDLIGSPIMLMGPDLPNPAACGQ